MASTDPEPLAVRHHPSRTCPLNSNDIDQDSIDLNRAPFNAVDPQGAAEEIGALEQ